MPPELDHVAPAASAGVEDARPSGQAQPGDHVLEHCSPPPVPPMTVLGAMRLQLVVPVHPRGILSGTPAEPTPHRGQSPQQELAARRPRLTARGDSAGWGSPRRRAQGVALHSAQQPSFRAASRSSTQAALAVSVIAAEPARFARGGRVALPAHRRQRRFAAAEPKPFGHACKAENGVRFCPTETLEQRVPTFDGIPLDADVTLPPTGEGPFPVIVMMHGWGGSKAGFESSSPAGDGNETFDYNNVYYAQQGFAVLNYSARGWGRSCG